MKIESPFLSGLLKAAQGKRVTMIFPESAEERILAAASILSELKAATPVLLGDSDEITAKAQASGIDISGCVILENTEELREGVKAEFLKITDRLTEKTLIRRLKDPQYLAAAMVRVKWYDCIASGYNCTTEETVMACQTMLGMREGISTVSSLCILEAPRFKGSEGNLICLTDCVVFPNPDSRELAEIAISSSDTMKNLLGWEPRTAMLSFSTKGGADNELVEKVSRAVEIANELRPDLLIDGEFQLDAAIDAEIAAKKVKTDSKVAGRANILVFPDLNAGNIGVKLINYFAELPVHGALIQGLSVPTVDFSRSATLDQIIGALLMLAVAAGKGKGDI